MKSNNNTFSDCHPLVNAVYFVLMLGFSMFVMNPVCILISLTGAFTYYIVIRGRRAIISSLTFILPLMLITAAVNPAFNHEGATILAYLPSGNPITLESIIYGLASAALLASAVMWFSCASEVMTSDKLIYLLGRIIPSLSLVLSMILRFVPRFKAQFKAAADAQHSIGQGISDGTIIMRLKAAVRVTSIMITWSLENAISTADSMKSRGWGMPGRSAYSIYRFTDRDKFALVWLSFCGVYLLSVSLAGGMYWRFYPTLKWAEVNAFGISFYLVYLALSLTPVIMKLWEDCKWKKLRSNV